MKIFHFGASPYIEEALIRPHLAIPNKQGFENMGIAREANSPLFSIYSAPFQSVPTEATKVFVHGLEGLIPCLNRGEKISELDREQGKPVLFLYPTTHSYEELHKIFNSMIPVESFSHIFLFTPRFLPFVKEYSNWSWLPFPVTSGPETKGEQWDTLRPKLNIFFAPLRSTPSEVAAIESAINSIPRAKERLNLEVLDNRTLTSLVDLRNAISRSDFVIDDIVTEDFGFVTFEALAVGRLAICGIEREILQQYPYYPMPILDCRLDTFVSKLEGVLSEPRSLRDFNKRAWSYIKGLGVSDKITLEVGKVL